MTSAMGRAMYREGAFHRLVIMSSIQGKKPLSVDAHAFLAFQYQGAGCRFCVSVSAGIAYGEDGCQLIPGISGYQKSGNNRTKPNSLPRSRQSTDRMRSRCFRRLSLSALQASSQLHNPCELAEPYPSRITTKYKAHPSIWLEKSAKGSSFGKVWFIIACP